MIKIEDKSKCSGCHACYSKCPQNCIQMIEDEEGYLYPQVDYDKCIKCGVCLNICPILNKNEILKIIKAYGCYNNDDETRINSSSGGIFSLIANSVLEQEGIVFGAMYDSNFNVVHNYVNNLEGLQDLRGSKYCQSVIGENFKLVKKNLLENKQVVFTGTPCQIAGLKKFLGKDYDNLVCVEILCHGVPSNKVFNKYLEEISNGKEIESINFRDKSESWDNYSLKIKYKDQSEFIQLSKENLYMQGFVNDFYLRPSCYECQFKGMDRYGDITLADFWGVDKVMPDLYDKKGVSLILINSEKGLKIFDKIKDKIFYEDADINQIIKYNPSMINLPKKEEKRDLFFKYINKVKFSQAMELGSIKSKQARLKMYLKFKLYNLRG